MGIMRYYIFSRKIQEKIHYDLRYESHSVTPSVCESVIESLNGTIHHTGLFELKGNNCSLEVLARIVRDANKHRTLDSTLLDKVA